MKLFKITSDTKVCSEKFVDWYEAGTAAQAMELVKEDAHRYGLPKDTEYQIVECDMETSKPLTQ